MLAFAAGELYVMGVDGSNALQLTSVTGAAMAYTPAQNHDPDGDSTGTSITVGKP